MSVFGSTFLFSQDSYPPTADESSILSFATKCQSSDRLFCFRRIHIRQRRTRVRFSPSLRNVGLRIDFFVLAGSSVRFSPSLRNVGLRIDIFVLRVERSMLSFATKCRSSDRLFCFSGGESSMLSFATKCRSSDRLFCFSKGSYPLLDFPGRWVKNSRQPP